MRVVFVRRCAVVRVIHSRNLYVVAERMANTNGPHDLSTGQMALDRRIASFLAGIQVDSISCTRSNTEQGSTASDQNAEDYPGQLMHAEQTMMAVDVPQRTRSARGAKPAPRKRRYRDDRQKLSNSMAQKRYRERKKKAFDSMKTLVDSLTLEVERLQYVKRENDRLTLEMQEYRQLADMHGMSRVQQPDVSTSAKDPRNPLPMDCPSTSQIQSRETTGHLFPLPGGDWIGTLSHICQCRSSVQMDGSVSLQARVKQLEAEWTERMTAVEHILRLQQSAGTTTGPASEHMLPILRTCMASMFSLNSDIASMKLQMLSQETQTNNDRIQKAFLFLTNEPK